MEICVIRGDVGIEVHARHGAALKKRAKWALRDAIRYGRGARPFVGRFFDLAYHRVPALKQGTCMRITTACASGGWRFLTVIARPVQLEQRHIRPRRHRATG
jgi:hypothetical protein